MHIILGASGHVGSAVASTLLKQGEPVTIVTHDIKKTSAWQERGAQVAVVDIHDINALNQVFRQGNRLFLLNPPADPSTDTATEERKSVSAILEAIDGSGLEKIVAESTYGAQPGDQLGDLGVLYEMEQGLATINSSISVIRAAYYMSNWDASLQSAREEGIIQTLYPVGFNLPMVSPSDIGEFAAHLLQEPIEKEGIHYIEGPQMYSATDVAKAFSQALNKPVIAVEVPREQWMDFLTRAGFSDKAATSMANMTAATLKEAHLQTNSPTRGNTSLQTYISDLAKKN